MSKFISPRKFGLIHDVRYRAIISKTINFGAIYNITLIFAPYLSKVKNEF